MDHKGRDQDLRVRRFLEEEAKADELARPAQRGPGRPQSRLSRLLNWILISPRDLADIRREAAAARESSGRLSPVDQARIDRLEEEQRKQRNLIDYLMRRDR